MQCEDHGPKLKEFACIKIQRRSWVSMELHQQFDGGTTIVLNWPFQAPVVFFTTPLLHKRWDQVKTTAIKAGNR
jgi:hypothetical protein